MTHDAQDHSNEVQVLKTDRRGRVWSTPGQRRAVLEQFERSGLSGPKFAAVAGIKYQTLVGWRRKRRLEQDEAPPKAAPESQVGALHWVEAALGGSKAGEGPEPASGLQVRWHDAVLIEITQAAQVSLAAALLQALENSGRRPC